jgi:hypothetical protein
MIQRREHFRFTLEPRQPIGFTRQRVGKDLDRDGRFRLVSVARYTSPMPPTPMNAEISNEPRRVPGVSATECWDYMRRSSERLRDSGELTRVKLRSVFDMPPARVGLVAIVLSIASASVGGADSAQRSAKNENVSATISSRRMADGKEWTTTNLNVNASPSYCYDDAESNCRRYGRLYTWASAQQACAMLGSGWRLPTDNDWRQMAKRYGGVSDEAADKGRAGVQGTLEWRHVGLQCRAGWQSLQWTVRTA